jgi:hypothetical protein
MTAVAAEDPFATDGVLFILKDLPELEAVLGDPLAPPDLSDFLAAKPRPTLSTSRSRCNVTAQKPAPILIR